MGAKKIADNNLSQDALLRSVKSSQVAPSLDSSLKPNEKALAESILNTLLEKSEGSDDYMLRLTSKNTDALMGRLETYFDKAKADFTSNELEEVKSAIIDAINAISSSFPQDQTKDSSDVLAAINAVVQQIEAIIQKKLDETVEQLKTLFDSNKAQLNVIASEEEKEDKEEKEDEGKDLEEFEAPSDKDEFTEEDLNQIQQFIGQQFGLLTKLVTDVGAQITTNIEAVNTAVLSLQSNMQSSINSLQPTPKEKKLSKQAKKTQDKINKIITNMEEALKKVENFVSNFVKVLISNFATFMNGVFKILFSFFLKLMLGIVIPFLIVVGLALYLLKEPLLEILQPIMDFIQDVLKQILDFLRPIRDLVIRIVEKIFEKIVLPILENVVKPILENVVKPLIDAIGAVLIEFFKAIKPWIKPLVDSVFKLLKTFLDAIQPWIEPLVNTIFSILQTFLQAIQPWIQPLVDVVLSTLVAIMETVKTVIEILNEFLKGFKSEAFRIGEAIGKVVLAVVDCIKTIVDFFTEVAQMLVDIAKILHAPIKFIADFFEGFNTNAKKIGEKVSEIALVMADIMLKILKFIDRSIGGIMKFLRTYVAAPISGLIRKMKTFQLQLARDFVIKVPTFNTNGSIKPWNWTIDWHEFHPFDFMTKGWTPAEMQQAAEDEGKSVSDLIADEMDKMEKQIKEEEKAEKAAQLAAQLQQKKIEDMLNNMKMIEDMSNQVKDIHEKLADGIETNNEIDFIDLIDEIQLAITSSFEQFKPQLDDIVAKVNDGIESLKGQFNELKSGLESKIEASTIELKQLSINNATTIVATTIAAAVALKNEIQTMFTAFKAELVEVFVVELCKFKTEVLQGIEACFVQFKDEIHSMLDELKIAIVFSIDTAKFALVETANNLFNLTIQSITTAVGTLTDAITALGESVKSFIVIQTTIALTLLKNCIEEKTNEIKVDLQQLSTAISQKFESIETKLLDGFAAISESFSIKFNESKEHFDTIISGIKTTAQVYYDSLFNKVFSIISTLDDVIDYELRIIKLLMLSEQWWFNNNNEDFPAKALERFVELKDFIVNDINNKIDDIVNILNTTTEKLEKSTKFNDVVNSLNTITKSLELLTSIKDFLNVDVNNKINSIIDSLNIIYESLEQFSEFNDSIDSIIDSLNIIYESLEQFSEFNDSIDSIIDNISIIAKILEQTIKISMTTDVIIDSIEIIFKELDQFKQFINNIESNVNNKIESIISNLDKISEEIVSTLPNDVVEQNDNMLQVSAQTSMPEIQSVDNIEQTGKSSTDNLMQDAAVQNPAEDLKADNKKAAKAQSKFQSGLMAYLAEKFGEVLEKLDGQGAQAVPIPIPTGNYSNLATMENA